MPRTIVLVGHCGPDMFMLKSAVGRFAPGAPIETINDAESLEPHLNPGAVLLINRVLDGRFGTSSGIDLIRDVADSDAPPAAILVSNIADAQQEAIAAGALPGFGKSELYDDRTALILREAIEG